MSELSQEQHIKSLEDRFTPRSDNFHSVPTQGRTETPHCHHPPPCCLPGRWRDQPHPGQQAQGLSPHCRRGDQPTVLPNNHAQQPLRLLATSCPSQISHPGFCTILNEGVKILAPLPPVSSHKTEQWAIALQPRHQSANFARLGAMVLPVQPLQRSPVGAWQLPCSPIHLFLSPPHRVARDSGGNKFQFAQTVTWSIPSWKSKFEIRAEPVALTTISLSLIHI